MSNLEMKSIRGEGHDSLYVDMNEDGSIILCVAMCEVDGEGDIACHALEAVALSPDDADALARAILERKRPFAEGT